MANLPYISPEIVTAYQRQTASIGSPATAKRRVSSLKKFFEWAHKEGHVGENPFEKVEKVVKVGKAARASSLSKRIKIGLVLGGAVGMAVLSFLLVRRLGTAIPSNLTPAQQADIPASKIKVGSPLPGSTAPPSQTTQTAVSFNPWTIYAKLNFKDASGEPIKTVQSTSFSLFNSEESTSPLWTSPAEEVTPDENGDVRVILKDVPTNLFFENETLYLAANLPEVSGGPRIQIPTASTQIAETAPLIGGDGNLLLAGESPSVVAESGNLLIEGQAVTIRTASASDGDIEINPDGTGIAHFLFEGTGQNFLNAQAPNLTRGSLYYGIVANNSTGYDLLRLQNGSKATTRFAVDAGGNTKATGNLAIGGNVLTSDVIRLTSTGALSNITGYSQTSGNFSIAQAAGETATITKKASALADLLTLTLDERPKPGNPNSGYSTLVLKRYDGAAEAFALFVDEGNARFDGQLQLGRFTSNPTSVGQGSLVFNTGDSKVYVWDGTTWNAVGSTELAVQESDTTVAATASSLDFLGGDFDLSESPANEANIQLAATLTSVIGVAGDFNIGGGDLTSTGAFTLSPGGAVLLGDGGDTLQIDSSDWDVSTTGDLSGIGTIAGDGDITLTQATPSIFFVDSTAASDDYSVNVDANAFTIVNSTDGRTELSFAGDGGITLGSATATTINLTTDGTGNAEVVLPNDAIGPNEVLSTGQTDEFCLTYELTLTTWEWQSCGGSTLKWNALTAPDGDLTLAMAAFNTTFNWDPGPDAAETNFSLTTQGEDTIGGGDEDQILLALSQTSNGVDVDEAADALLTLANADANDPVNSAIRFDAGAAGTDFTYGINFDAASIGTAELIFQNAETIDNTVDGTVNIGATTLELTGGTTIHSNQTTVALLNTTTTTINFGAATTTINQGPTGSGASSIVLSGGSGDTGCTLDGSNGNLTCSGAISGSAASTKWNVLTAPDGDLTLAMAAFNTTFNWDPGPDTTETNFSLTTQGEDTTGTGDQDQVLLALSQTANGVDVDEAADALLTLANADADDPVNNAIRFDAGGAGTDFTYGINFDAASFGTAELILSNAETISNLVDGTIDFGATTLASSATTVNFSSAALTVTSCTGCGGGGTLQTAYDAGNTITTTTARDIEITLADVATDTTFEITQAGAADALRINDDGTFTDTTAFVVDQSGNVGIGNSSPTTAFHVGTNAETHALSTGDALISSDLELDGIFYLDGGIIADVVGTSSILLSATPTTTVSTLTNASWLVNNTANVGMAALLVDQQKAGDLITASAAGTTRFLVQNDGDVFITTSHDSTTASLTVSDTSGTGTGKINVGTVDPVYTVGDGKYATFMAGMVGVKEEVTGTVFANEFIPGIGYRKTIDFKTLETASDLWLFSKTTNLKDNIDKLVVLLSPEGNSRAWYRVDDSNYTLSIYSTKPTNISFRLTAPRFDYAIWTNYNHDEGVTGFILPDEQLNGNGEIDNPEEDSLANYQIERVETDGGITYQLRDLAGNIINEFAKVSDFLAANIQAGILRADNVVTNNLTAAVAIVDELRVDNKLISPVIETDTISPLADSSDVTVQIGRRPGEASGPEGNEGGFGKLIVENTEGEEVASVDTSGNASFEGTVEADSVKTNDVIAGKIYADEIVARNGYFGQTKVESAGGITREQIEQILSEVEESQGLLAQAATWSVNTATESAELTTVNGLQATDLYVTGQAAINSLSVTSSIAIGPDLVLQSTVDSSQLAVSSIDTLSSPLSLQSLALAPVEIMAGKIRIETNGDVYIDANLYVAGNIESQGLKAEEASLNKLTTEQLIIAGAETATPSAVVNGEIQTNATVGQAQIASGVTEITIRNPKITDYTLVYITPTSPTENKTLYVKSKGAGFFTVGFSDPISADATFNWWVVEVAQ